MTINLEVHLPTPHDKQQIFLISPAKRKVVRAGRRSGKTVGTAIKSVNAFLDGRRVLYATPTSEQVDRFWVTVTNALEKPIQAKLYYKNETEHVIELRKTEQRIRAKTAWNADTLRGDYADILILDEFQIMNENAWGLVGAPMLLDNNGDAIFIYTPPSLHSRSISKAKDPLHAAKLFKRASLDKSGRWETFSFTSHDNPYISEEALADITLDMTALAYRQEIMAEDVNEAPGALWTREIIENGRVLKAPDTIDQIVVGVDPSATSAGNETGIITSAKRLEDFYVLSDDSVQGSPLTWAQTAVTAYYKYQADAIIAESNQGGEMVLQTIKQVDATVPVRLVHASRGKATRAEPVAAIYEHGRGHHVGTFPNLEDEMCQWIPGDASPNRMDALVWAITELDNPAPQDTIVIYDERVHISAY